MILLIAVIQQKAEGIVLAFADAVPLVTLLMYALITKSASQWLEPVA
jgi:hypothetical protein